MDTVYIVYHLDGNDRCAEAFNSLEAAERYELTIARDKSRKPWLVAMPVRGADWIGLRFGDEPMAA